MDSIHEKGQEGKVKKLPEDPKIIKQKITERVKALLMRIVGKK